MGENISFNKTVGDLSSISPDWLSSNTILKAADTISSIQHGQGTVSTNNYCHYTTKYSNLVYNPSMVSEPFYVRLLSTEEFLGIAKTIFKKYGFEYRVAENKEETSVRSNSELSSLIFGWICCGFYNKTHSLYPWYIRDVDHQILTLEASSDLYFDDFTVRVLLEQKLIFVDSRGSNIINLIQEDLINNLTEAISEIYNISLGEELFWQNTIVDSGECISTLNYTVSSDISATVGCCYDADTTLTISNNGTSVII